MKAPFIACAVLLVLGVRTARAQTPDGRALYMENCRTCHGAAGKPTHMALTQYPKIPSFADTTLMRGLSEDSIVAVLQHGLGKDMKSFKQKLSPTEMAAVARFVRTLAGSPGKTP